MVSVVARRAPPLPGHRVRVTMRNRGREPLSFDLAQDALPLRAGEPGSPWLVAPPGVCDVLRRMQRNLPTFGAP